MSGLTLNKHCYFFLLFHSLLEFMYILDTFLLRGGGMALPEKPQGRGIKNAVGKGYTKKAEDDLGQGG